MTATREQMRALARVSNARWRANAAWGRRTRAQRGWLAMSRAYPSLMRRWAENAWRTRWGYPLLPVPKVASIKAKRASTSTVTVQRGRTP